MRRASRWLPGPTVAAILITSAFAALGWALIEHQRAARWADHTKTVLLNLQDMFSGLQDAETGVRGYVITKDREFLKPYETGVPLVWKNWQELKDLTVDNASQKASLGTLGDHMKRRIEALEKSVQSVGNTEYTAAYAHEGKALMDKVRGEVTLIRTIEENLLNSRKARNDWLSSLLAISAALTGLVSLLAFTSWISASNESVARLTSLNTELEKSMAEQKAASEQLRQLQKLESIGQLTGGIAHDFNNMLAVITGSLNLATKRLASGDQNIAPLLDGAIDGANRAADLTRRLLAFARQQPLAPAVLDVNAVVSGMGHIIARAIGENLKTETILASGLWRVHADKSALESAILNLCVNARDAMPDGGKITIETANAFLDENYARGHYEVKAGQYVLISVTDTGAGMPPEIVGKAFEPFFTTKESGKGTGLGLAQVHGFLKQSKGHVKIYSELDVGTSVKLYFPRSDTEEGQHKESAIDESAELPGGVILVVEDDARVRVTTAALVRELGFKVIEAENATAALPIIERGEPIDLLFTDMVMPGMNGRKLADAALQLRPGLKVLYTTGYTRNAIVHNGTLDRGVHLLTKPFTIDQLARKLREVMS